ncbi:hypothetical protein PS15m_010249 [Mucor circinelloides]
MVNNLHINDLCEKVYVSPICRANSDLLARDESPTATVQSILDQLRFQNGDMQDFIMFAKTTTSPIRLVVLDYAGLSTNPLDIRIFVKSIKSINQIVIDHGHKLESLNRAELNNHKVITKFDSEGLKIKTGVAKKCRNNQQLNQAVIVRMRCCLSDSGLQNQSEIWE